MKTIGGSIHKCQKVCWLLTCISLHFLDASYVERPQQWTFGSVPCWLWHFDLLMLKWIKQYFNWVEIWRFKGHNHHILKYDGQSSFLLSPNLQMSPTLTHFDILDHFGMLFADCLLMVFQGSSLSRHVTWHIERLSVYLRRLSLMQAERFCQSFIFFFKDWWQNIPDFFTPNF